MEDDATFLLAEIAEDGGPRYVLYRQVASPVAAGEDGVPLAALEWLLNNKPAVRAARLLPEQARGLLEKGVSASLGADQNND